MTMNRISSIIVLVIFSLPIFLFTNAGDEDAIAKKKAADDYRKNIVATDITNAEQLGWTGNVNRCKPGKLSHDTYVKMVARINYFRRLAGVNDNMVLDSSWNKYAQAAALIMFANNTLNHNPNSGMKCFTEEGKTGASTSNLSLFTGVSIQALIKSEIEDGGVSNKDCGHRRWLLYSKAYKFGFGATAESYAVRDFASSEEKDTSSFHGKTPEYFGYPFKGFVPFQVVYPKWSFAIPGKLIDFTTTTVVVTAGDKAIPNTVISRGKANYGDPTIVWSINGMKEDFDYQSLDASRTFYHYYDMSEKRKSFESLGLFNKKVTVKISNVKVDGKLQSYTYSFTIFNPEEFN